MLEVKKPEKKVGNYISKIKENNKNIKLSINNTKFVNIKNNILKLFIENTDDITNLTNIDNKILKIIINNNEQWFNNNLNETKIKEYFRYSIDNLQSIMSIMISEIKLPMIFFNNKQISSLKDITIEKDYIINIEIEAHGLYFFKDKVGIRWILRSIYIYDIKNIINDNDILVNKQDIEEEWQDEINEFFNKLNEDHNILNRKINFIDNLKREISEEYDKIKKMDEMNRNWNNSLKQISTKISKYINGTLK